MTLELCVPKRLSMQKEISNWLGGDLSQLHIFATQNLSVNVLPFIDRGTLCSLGVEGSINQLQSERIVFRPLTPALTATCVLAWKKFQPNFGAASRFLDFFKNMQNEHESK